MSYEIGYVTQDRAEKICGAYVATYTEWVRVQDMSSGGAKSKALRIVKKAMEDFNVSGCKRGDLMMGVCKATQSFCVVRVTRDAKDTDLGSEVRVSNGSYTWATRRLAPLPEIKSEARQVADLAFIPDDCLAVMEETNVLRVTGQKDGRLTGEIVIFHGVSVTPRAGTTNPNNVSIFKTNGKPKRGDFVVVAWEDEGKRVLYPANVLSNARGVIKVAYTEDTGTTAEFDAAHVYSKA